MGMGDGDWFRGELLPTSGPWSWQLAGEEPLEREGEPSRPAAATACCRLFPMGVDPLLLLEKSSGALELKGSLA